MIKLFEYIGKNRIKDVNGKIWHFAYLVEPKERMLYTGHKWYNEYVCFNHDPKYIEEKHRKCQPCYVKSIVVPFKEIRYRVNPFEIIDITF